MINKIGGNLVIFFHNLGTFLINIFFLKKIFAIFKNFKNVFGDHSLTFKDKLVKLWKGDETLTTEKINELSKFIIENKNPNNVPKEPELSITFNDSSDIKKTSPTSKLQKLNHPKINIPKFVYNSTALNPTYEAIRYKFSPWLQKIVDNAVSYKEGKKEPNVSWGKILVKIPQILAKEHGMKENKNASALGFIEFFTTHKMLRKLFLKYFKKDFKYKLLKTYLHKGIVDENSYLPKNTTSATLKGFNYYLNPFAKHTYIGDKKKAENAEENVKKTSAKLQYYEKIVSLLSIQEKNYEKTVTEHQNLLNQGKEKIKYTEQLNIQKENLQEISKKLNEYKKEKIKCVEQLNTHKENQHFKKFKKYEEKLKFYFDKIEKLNKAMHPSNKKKGKKVKKDKIFSKKDLERIFEIIFCQT